MFVSLYLPLRKSSSNNMVKTGDISNEYLNVIANHFICNSSIAAKYMWYRNTLIDHVTVNIIIVINVNTPIWGSFILWQKHYCVRNILGVLFSLIRGHRQKAMMVSSPPAFIKAFRRIPLVKPTMVQGEFFFVLVTGVFFYIKTALPFNTSGIWLTLWWSVVGICDIKFGCKRCIPLFSANVIVRVDSVVTGAKWQPQLWHYK